MSTKLMIAFDGAYPGFENHRYLKAKLASIQVLVDMHVERSKSVAPSESQVAAMVADVMAEPLYCESDS